MVPDECLKLESIPVVSGFPEVFPKDLRGIPLVREVEFSIDLILGCTPISKLPYQMTPTELEELKCSLKTFRRRASLDQVSCLEKNRSSL